MYLFSLNIFFVNRSRPIATRSVAARVFCSILSCALCVNANRSSFVLSSKYSKDEKQHEFFYSNINEVDILERTT